MEEESNENYETKINATSLCKCYYEYPLSSENVEVSARKEFIFSAVLRTEQYLRKRRIPELIRFLFTKVIAQSPNRPVVFLEKLLDDCMLFRAGHGIAPVLYENRHLEAVIKSFDPGQRGWLSAGQIRRLYTTLGFTVKESIEDRTPNEIVLEDLKVTQENDLIKLLSPGLLIIEDTDSFINDQEKERYNRKI